MNRDDNVRHYIKDLLNTAQLELTPNDQLRLEDQLIELAGSLARADEIDRDEVFRRAEERILHNFRPPAKPKGLEQGAC
ncbi:MAG TPA: hypothetical protein VJZ26_08645 [Blastocatellia bacterium]|nr:hypothetical protein [Blastocatellia bacterium]